MNTLSGFLSFNTQTMNNENQGKRELDSHFIVA